MHLKRRPWMMAAICCLGGDAIFVSKVFWHPQEGSFEKYELTWHLNRRKCGERSNYIPKIPLRVLINFLTLDTLLQWTPRINVLYHSSITLSTTCLVRKKNNYIFKSNRNLRSVNIDCVWQETSKTKLLFYSSVPSLAHSIKIAEAVICDIWF